MRQAPATAKVHEFLVSEKRYAQERGITPERIKIIDRLLNYAGLEPAWAEILEKATPIYLTGSTLMAWQLVVARLLWVAEYHSPEKAKSLWATMDDVTRLNKEIAEGAAELARKMRYRLSLQGPHNVTLPADSDPLVLMERAAELAGIGHNFRDEIKPDIERMRWRRGWPDTTDMLDALAEAQGEEEYGYIDPTPTDEVGAASVDSPKRGHTDFYRALDKALAELHDWRGTGVLGSELTTDTYADICNAILGLVGADIKPKAIATYRNNERNRIAQQSGTTHP